MQTLQSSRLFKGTLYFLGYLLLLEWLHPLNELTSVANNFVFILFIVAIFFMELFSLNKIIQVIVLVCFIFCFINFLYYPAFPLVNVEWLSLFTEDSFKSLISIYEQDWANVTSSFRTILFFMLLWTMTYLLHYWLKVRQSMFLFFFLTIIYISVLDTFTPYDGDWAIVRLFIVGIWLIGLLVLSRKLQHEKIRLPFKQVQKWHIVLGVIVVFSVTIGLFAPKLSAQWDDPIPFIVSYSEKFKEGEGVSRVGYGADDTKLGGDFKEDDTVVFTAATNAKHYWFVETKDVYTGKGWIYHEGNAKWSVEPGDIIPITNPYNLDIQLTKAYTAKVDVKIPEKHVLLPNGTFNTSIHAPDINHTLELDVENRKLTSSVELGQYTAVYQVPTYDVEYLRALDYQFPIPEDSRFLQLPIPLPSRISQLAHEITDGIDNKYDKVKAIEQYFKRSDFTYQKEDIPYPEGDKDFVDQFLFDTKRGYCDHFSSSMVVLLRTLGIEARWVKGYTSGEYTGITNGMSSYQVTNNNAHSWVEVWFEELGAWLPFEPTKGFDIGTRLDNGATATAIDDQMQQNEEPKTPDQQERNDERLRNETEAKEENEKIIEFDLITFVKENWATYLVILVVIVVITLLLYVFRGKWLPYIWLAYYKRSSREDTFIKAYQRLLKELGRARREKATNETLREYATIIDGSSNKEMAELTLLYERMLYGNGDPIETWTKAYPIWKSVMKKTIT